MMLLLLTPDHRGCDGGYFAIAIDGPRSSQLLCCCLSCVTRLPKSLLDRVPVVVVAADMVFRLHLEGGTCW